MIPLILRGPYRLQPERVRFHPDDYPSGLYGTRVLGIPVGHDAFVESYLHNFIADLAAQGDLLAKYAKDEP